MATLSVNGNQNFVNISNISGQIPRLVSNTINTRIVNTQTINGKFLWISPFTNKKMYSLTGNASANLGGTTGGSTQFLNSQPGQPSSLTTAGGVLVLPPGATIVGAYAIDRNLGGPVTSFDIGTHAITGAAPVSSNNLFTGALKSSLQDDGLIVTSQFIPTANTIPGTTGALASGSTPVSVPSTGSTGLVVTPDGDVLFSSLTVTIYYYI